MFNRLTLLLFKFYFKIFPKKVLLGLHSVGCDGMSKIKLSQLCSDLKTLGFNFSASCDDLLASNIKSNMVHITFDDGYLNNYTDAFEVLNSEGVLATVFLSTDYILGDVKPGSHGLSCLPALSIPNINVMIENGWNFGFHTASHINLYQSDWNDTMIDFKRGVSDFNRITSNKFSESLLFAYPFGCLPCEKPRFEKLMDSHNVVYAITTRWGEVSNKISANFYINRVMLGDNDNRFWMLLKISGLINIYDRLKWRGAKYDRRY